MPKTDKPKVFIVTAKISDKSYVRASDIKAALQSKLVGVKSVRVEVENAK